MADVNTTGKIKIEGDVSGAEQAFNDVIKATSKIEKAAQSAAGNVDKAFKGAAGQVSDTWKDAGNKVNGESNRIKGAADHVSNGVKGIANAAGEVGGKFKAFSVVAVGALLEIGGAAIRAAGEIIGKLGEALKGSISLAGDFEGGMNQFAAAAGKGIEESGKKLKDFQDLFIEMGKKLPVSTMDVQQAAITLVKGGIDPAIIAAGGLESSLKFAAGAEVDLNRAAEIGVKQLSLFGDVSMTAAQKADFLAKAQDLLVKAGNASAGNVDQLSDAVLMSGGAANAAGLDYRDFIQMVTLISDKMPSAAEAGTSFKNMLMSLNPHTKTSVNAFQELGLMTFNVEKAMQTLTANGMKPVSKDAGDLTEQLLKLAESNKMTDKETEKFLQTYQSSSFFDATGKFIGGRDAIDKLRAAFVNLTDADKMRLAQQAFGNDGMNAAMALINGGTDAWDNYTKAIDNANGVDQQAAATQKGLNFMIDQFKGSLEALGIIVGLKFLPAMTGIAAAATGVLNGLEPLINFLSTGSAIGFQQFYNAMDSAFGPTAATKITDFVKDAKGVLTGLQEWLSGDPLGAETFKNALASMFGADTATQITDFATGAKNTINDVVAFIQENWPKIQEIIQAVIIAVSGFVTTQLIPAIQSIQPLFEQVVAWIKTNWPNIQLIISDVINAIVVVVRDVLLPIIAGISIAIGAVIAFIVEHWPEIRQAIGAVVDQIKIKLDGYIQMIELAFNQAKNAVQWMKDFVAAISKGWEDLKREVTTAWQKIETWFNTIPNILNSIGVNIMKGLIDGIKAQADAVFQAISGVVTNAIDGVKKLLNIHSPSKEFEDIGRMTMEGMRVGIEKNGDSVLASLLSFVGKAVALANQTAAQAVTGSTAHISPDAVTAAAARGMGEGSISPYVQAGQASNHGDTSVPVGLTRDDWDAHDRRDAPQPAIIQLDGATLAAALIGRMGQVLQQDARRYGG